MKNEQNNNKFLNFCLYLIVVLTFYSCKNENILYFHLNLNNDSNKPRYYLLNNWLSYKYLKNQDSIIVDTNVISNFLIKTKSEKNIFMERSPNAKDDNKNVYPFEHKPIFLKLSPKSTSNIEFIYKDLDYDDILFNDSIFLYSSLIILDENNIDSNCIIISNLKNIKFEYNEKKLLLNLPEIKITDEEQIIFQDKYFNNKLVKLKKLDNIYK